MSISTTSIATTLGIGSGIDMAGLATQLSEAQFEGRNQRLTNQSETLERRISLAGAIRSSRPAPLRLSDRATARKTRKSSQ